MDSATVEIVKKDIFAFDFEYAKELDINLDEKSYETLESLYFIDTKDGKLFLNTATDLYSIIREIFEDFSDVSTKELSELYRELVKFYPNDNDFIDTDRYSDLREKNNIIIKVLMKFELSRRRKRSSKLQNFIQKFN
jgi:hypothetical protein